MVCINNFLNNDNHDEYNHTYILSAFIINCIFNVKKKKNLKIYVTYFLKDILNQMYFVTELKVKN